MNIKANNVDSECDWITEGKEYSADKKHNELALIVDDNGQKEIIHLGAYFHLNEYVEWEII